MGCKRPQEPLIESGFFRADARSAVETVNEYTYGIARSLIKGVLKLAEAEKL